MNNARLTLYIVTMIIVLGILSLVRFSHAADCSMMEQGGGQSMSDTMGSNDFSSPGE
ncbi:MAG: hypothetical protein ACLGPL_06220 [Acidobacteriota bacterium]